ncbi:cytochrome P450, partial [Suillus paluster]|uniref:cytochrome P450 n=1 Tax=Suillus paluster TaxID=48578 RepID=UPI001B875544
MVMGNLVLSAAACLGVVGVIARAHLYKSKEWSSSSTFPAHLETSGALHTPSQVKFLILLVTFNANRVTSLISPFLTVAGWIDEYGPLITIRSGTEKIVIIGRHSVAVDIMEKQGASLADRPRLIAAGDMLGGGVSTVHTPAGSLWRRMRRALHAHLHPRATEEYQPLQMSYAKDTVLNILKDPYNFHNHAATYAVTIVTKVAYGKTTPMSATDSVARRVREHFQILRRAIRPGAYLVDSIPWLKYIPWYGQELKEGFEKNRRLYISQLDRVKQQMQSNADIGPSFVKHMLEGVEVHGLTELEMAFTAGGFFAAGIDTTTLAICTVLMAAACFPEEQAKVQAELDAVVGSHRAPTFADEQSLPRLCAFVSEALRWRPLVPGGVAHRTTKDVVWGNYCMPAGTTVVGHHWSISQDPDVFPEP